MTLNRTEVVYAISVLEDPVSVDIAVHGAMFKVLAAPRASLPFTLNATQPDGGGVCFGAVRVCITTVGTEELSGFLHMFSGDYTSYSASLKPDQVLLVWPHKLLARQASMNIRASVTRARTLPQTSQLHGDTVSIPGALILAALPRLVIAASLIAGGYLLYRWSRRT